MTPIPHRSTERHVDVCVIGGSAAGLAGALQLARQRRSVVVVDSGEPRNAPAAHMHGYLGHEALPPRDLVALGREEVRSYGGEIIEGTAREVTPTADGRFRVELDGIAVVARRVLAATGLRDELPAIEGLAEHWGREVVHCPFCHGYEVRDQRVVQVLTHPMGLHPTQLFAHLTSRLTLVVTPQVEVGPEQLEPLAAAGVSVIHAGVRRVLEAPDGRLRGLELTDGRELEAEAVVIGAGFRARAEVLAPLGLEPVPHESGLGDVVAVDLMGQTTVPGVYAAGNVTDPSLQVLPAAARGSQTGAMIAFSLAAEELESGGRTAPHESDWDHRYGGEQIWSGHPNGSLVDEMSDAAPGSALDVGAGEGGDALWLAGRGWRVTASDVTTRALERIGAAAAQAGLEVELLHADANARDPFPATYDLVTAHYASVPRSPDRRAVRNLIAAVAPGGTLLVVNHDPAPLREPAEHPRAYDVDAYVALEDFRAALAEEDAWVIEVDARRPRDHGTAVSHHVDDVVLRARRR